MPTIRPYHSARPGSPKVHHDQDVCWDGNNIEAYWFKLGTGGFPRCTKCDGIAAESLRQARLAAARALRRPY